jgi:hypothetical protein
MSNGVSIVVKYGHYKRESLSFKFVDCSDKLNFLVPIVDIRKAYVTSEADSRLVLLKKLTAMPSGSSDTNNKINKKLQGVLRAAATCDDPSTSIR